MFIKSLTLSILIFSAGIASAQTTTTAPDPNDPLKTILDKLDSIEKRLDDLESGTNSQNTGSTQSNSNQSQQAKPSPAPQKDEMVDGLVIKIKVADTSQRKWFTNGISDESFAGFVTNEYKLTTKTIQDKSLGYKGAYALDAQGYFNAKEKGTYTFGVLHQIENRSMHCMAHISLNGTELTKATTYLTDEVNLLVNGSVELEPGLYEYSTFTVCGDGKKYYQAIRTFLVKTPSDLNLRPFESGEILHKK